jgi:hypothetical protein
VTLRLHGIRLASDLAVSGHVVWSRYGHTSTMRLRVARVDARGRVVPSDSVNGTLTGTWDTRAADARVSLSGPQGGHAVAYAFRAP